MESSTLYIVFLLKRLVPQSSCWSGLWACSPWGISCPSGRGWGPACVSSSELRGREWRSPGGRDPLKTIPKVSQDLTFAFQREAELGEDEGLEEEEWGRDCLREFLVSAYVFLSSSPTQNFCKVWFYSWGANGPKFGSRSSTPTAPFPFYPFTAVLAPSKSHLLLWTHKSVKAYLLQFTCLLWWKEAVVRSTNSWYKSHSLCWMPDFFCPIHFIPAKLAFLRTPALCLWALHLWASFTWLHVAFFPS